MKRHGKTGLRRPCCYSGILTALLVLCIVLQGGKTRAFADGTFSPKSISDASVNKTDTVTAAKKSVKSVSGKFRVAYSQTALDLLNRAVKAKGKGKNILLSPDSILTALGMTELGASGKTKKEMVRSLGQGIGPVGFSQYLAGFHKHTVTGGDPNKHAVYQVADSIWYRRGAVTFKEKFLKKVKAYYDAEIYEGDFDSRTVSDINSWVYNGTRGMIPKILERLSPSQNMVLINAVRFEGTWSDPMNSVSGVPFRNGKGAKKKASMIGGSADRYLKVKGGEGFLKYYRGGKFAFMALLPPKGMTPEKYLSGLKGKDLAHGFTKSKKLSSGISIRVTMPEFKFSTELGLRKILKKMGVRTAFTGNADFSGICDENLMIDDVLHKAVIELDKNGTKAAAVTAVIMKASSMPFNKTVHIKLDRPFVFAIVDTKSGLPVFLGILNNP